ncbi:hypothetical protein ACFSKN_01525 [Mariniflexile gromovii]|uniref:Uncharacterized protein n=1 Tax=Mariniflexile gromovii TaxID=362523 RepID=A0ABS4BSJ0_9FLAO|nr:hypothetical protein [Mariniflexile gromovii]MBP0903556.1 hypothetical protein [Mariniflexile gromovii]
MEKNINEFLLLISDPKNISPDDFAEYYPKAGEFWNKKNLDKTNISKHFSSLQRFKISDDWNGYISLQAKIYFLLESYNKLSINDKEISLNYFSIMSRDLSFKTQSFISDKILTKKEYYELLGAYTIFVKNLTKTILNEFKALLNKENESTNNKSGKHKTKIKPFKENIIKPWNEKGKEAFEGFIKKKFNDIKDKYENKKKKNLYLLALALRDLCVLSNEIENKHLLHTVGNLFIGPEKIIIVSDESGFNSIAKIAYKNQLDYKNYIKDIETIINERMIIYKL